jgi:hypothetical protein
MYDESCLFDERLRYVERLGSTEEIGLLMIVRIIASLRIHVCTEKVTFVFVLTFADFLWNVLLLRMVGRFWIS